MVHARGNPRLRNAGKKSPAALLAQTPSMAKHESIYKCGARAPGLRAISTDTYNNGSFDLRARNAPFEVSIDW